VSEEKRVLELLPDDDIRRAILAGQGIAVLVAALYARPDLLAWNRANIPGYFEIYLKANLDLLRERDSKGLHRKVENGRLNNAVGVDIPWHSPVQPDLVINAAAAIAPDELAADLVKKIPSLDSFLAQAVGPADH